MARTVYETFAAAAQRAPHADLLVVERVTAQAYGIDATVWSYALAAARVEALRARYARAGYGHGHRAGLLLENRPDFFWHWWALNALGVSVVPINGELRSAEMRYMIVHSDMCLAIALPQRVTELRAAAPEGHALVIVTPETDAVVPDAPMPAPRGAEVPDRSSECALLYTSGTTGLPKGCVLSNDYYLRAGQWYAGIGGLAALRPGAERLITPLPLSHMNAMAYSAMAMLTTGGCLIQLDRFHPGSWWRSVRETQATVVHYLGVMPAMLLSAPADPADRAHAVRFGFGAGVDRRQHAGFEARFGFALLEAWAMTETGAGAVVIANEEPRHVGHASFGRPAADVQWRLVTASGADAAVDEPGELWVRASGADPRRGFFREYLKDPQATALAWEGGWFHTGDLVRRDARDNLYFVDRQKNVIRRSGENISAVEVESVLALHPRVKAVAVAATPDDVRGDEVLACVVLREGDPRDGQATARAQVALALEPELVQFAHELVQFALERLAYYKAPGYVAFVQELPLTVSQKIQRAQLKALAQALPGQAHCVDTRALKKRQA